VFSGVTDPALLLAAGPLHRPDLISADAGGLLVPHPPVTGGDGEAWHCGRWVVTARDGGPLELRTTGDDRDTGDGLDGLRALCLAAWERAPEGAPAQVQAAGGEARRVLAEWGLAAR
jgi:glycerol-1-phosphatase